MSGMTYSKYFLDREYTGIKKISSKLGKLQKIPIIDKKSHGFCYNNCINYKSNDYEIVSGFYVVMNIEYGVYEFLRHAVIRENGILKDITDPGHNISSLYFIETTKNFYELSIRQFYLDNEFSSDYSLLDDLKGEYYIYGLFDTCNKPFYIGKGKGNRAQYHLTERSLSSDANKHKVNKIKKIGPENVSIKLKYKNLLDEDFAYDLEELTILSIGLDNLTNICIGSNTPNFKDMTLEL